MNDQRTAVISGARGQDASHLSELLLDKGWMVIAFERHVQSPDYTNLKNVIDNPNYILEKADITDQGSLNRLVDKYKPDHFYHLAANSFVGCSWQEPTAVLNVNTGGTLNVLESIRTCSPKTKVLLASTSEVVGNSKDYIQDEDTILTPCSPYAVSKAAGEHFIKVYRKSYGLFCAFTRCYNHEGTRRGKEFVTRKITDWIGQSWNKVDKNIDKLVGSSNFIDTQQAFEKALEIGIIEKLKLGNLKSSRDWLDARDCVRGMHLVLEQDKPDDFVLSSGKMRSISDFLESAFSVVGISDWKPFIGQDPRYIRPDDVVTLCGNYDKAKRHLGWEPKISFDQMVKEMVENDIKLNEKTQ